MNKEEWIKCEKELPPCNGNYECLEDLDGAFESLYYDGFRFYREDNYNMRTTVEVKWWRHPKANIPKYGKQPTCHEWEGKIKAQLPSSNPNDWYIVASQTGKDADGFPVGEHLCPTLLDVSSCIRERRIDCPMIRKYKQEPTTGTVYYEF